MGANNKSRLIVVALTILVLGTLAIQWLRGVQDEVVFRDLESCVIKGETFSFASGGCFVLYARPLGIEGYGLFDDKLYVLESNGSRHAYVCRYKSKTKFLHCLRCFLGGDAEPSFGSFRELWGCGMIRTWAGWKPPYVLGLIDAMFLALFMALLLLFFAVLTKRKRGMRGQKISDCKLVE